MASFRRSSASAHVASLRSALIMIMMITIGIGETSGEKLTLPWCVPPTPGNYLTRAIKEGDTVFFDWEGEYHNAWYYPSGDCNNRTDRIFLGETAPASYTFESGDAGTSMAFVCDAGNHCQAGQFVVFDVVGANDEDIVYSTETPCGEGYVGEEVDAVVVVEETPVAGSGGSGAGNGGVPAAIAVSAASVVLVAGGILV